MIRTPKYLRFLDKIMVSSRKTTPYGNFEVPQKQKEWKICDELKDIFFTDPILMASVCSDTNNLCACL